MAGVFKNDLLLRTVLAVFIGVLAFCLLFNLFTGGGNTMGGEHMGNMGTAGGYGYSFGGLFGGLLLLLVKLLMVVLVVAVVIGIFIWIKKNFFQNANSKFIQSINNDPILKTISVVTLAIIGIVLLLALFNGFGQTGMGYGGQMGGYGYGFNASYGIAGILTILIKVLSFVLVVSLILAIAAYIKKQVDSGNLNLFGTGKEQGSDTQTGNTAGQQNYGTTDKTE